MVQYARIADFPQTPAEAHSGEGGHMSMEERIQIRDLDVYAVADKGDVELKSGRCSVHDPACCERQSRRWP